MVPKTLYYSLIRPIMDDNETGTHWGIVVETLIVIIVAHVVRSLPTNSIIIRK